MDDWKSQLENVVKSKEEKERLAREATQKNKKPVEAWIATIVCPAVIEVGEHLRNLGCDVDTKHAASMTVTHNNKNILEISFGERATSTESVACVTEYFWDEKHGKCRTESPTWKPFTTITKDEIIDYLVKKFTKNFAERR